MEPPDRDLLIGPQSDGFALGLSSEKSSHSRAELKNASTIVTLADKNPLTPAQQSELQTNSHLVAYSDWEKFTDTSGGTPNDRDPAGRWKMKSAAYWKT